ncbi:MAG: Electron transfer [Thermoleophilia bacterium]|nr:Electron transfer [Thermoleophilia bacterium]
MSTQPAPIPTARPLPLAARLLAIPALVAVLLVGLWFWAGVVAPGYNASIGFAVGWFVAVAVGLRFVRRWMPSLNRVLQVTFLVTSVAIGAGFAWTTFRDVTVNEQIVVGSPSAEAGAGNVQLSSGQFVGVAHGASGTAAVVELPSGERMLTFADLDTDNGPDLRVYLVAGPVTGDDDVADFVDLGGLKGNKGNQQYDISSEVDVDRYSTVVIWCRAFTVSFARAELTG